MKKLFEEIETTVQKIVDNEIYRTPCKLDYVTLPLVRKLNNELLPSLKKELNLEEENK